MEKKTTELLNGITVEEKDDGYWVMVKNGAVCLRKESLVAKAFIEWDDKRRALLIEEKAQKPMAEGGIANLEDNV